MLLDQLRHDVHRAHARSVQDHFGEPVLVTLRNPEAAATHSVAMSFHTHESKGFELTSEFDAYRVRFRGVIADFAGLRMPQAEDTITYRDFDYEITRVISVDPVFFDAHVSAQKRASGTTPY
jgi:hypothetical protein